MKKIYLLTSGINLYEKAVSNSSYKNKIEIIPKQRGVIGRCFRRVFYFLNLPFKFIWIKKYKFQDNSIFIVTDGSPWSNNIEYIRNKYTGVTIIFWCWNSGINEKKMEYIKKYSDTVYTFDEKEAKKFKIRFIPQFYWLSNENKNKEEFDVFYVGQKSNREKEIFEIYKVLEKLKLKLNFYIVDKKHKMIGDLIKLHSKALGYEEVIENIKKSKILLEINKKGQSGLTLRALEALFFEKKLITNNKSIEKYDFYNKNNILVIDFENYSVADIIKFLNTKKEVVSQEIKKKYHVDNWLRELLREYDEKI